MKRCSRCKVQKPLSEFHNHKGMKDGKDYRCRQCKFQVNKEYYSSSKGKSAVSGQTKRKWLRNREVILARNLLNLGLKRGKATKQKCVICGTLNDLQAHHNDYSKPYEVKWYCRKHHLEHHGKRLSHDNSII